MKKKVLVAGASGQLGRRVIEELHRRGHWVRALARDPSKLAGARAWADDVFTGDATRAATLENVTDGVDVVFSALGAPLNVGPSKDCRVSYREVDYVANRNLLDQAVAGRSVEQFVYVSVFGAELYGHLEYVRAHEDFVRELERSGLAYTVMRPTGFFSAFAEVLRMARRGGVGLIGDGNCRTNPIHEADLATACVDVIEAGEDAPRAVMIGGPEIFTRRKINELAFAALGKRPRVMSVPAWLPGVLLRRGVRPLDPRLHDLLSFLVTVSQVDVVAPAHRTTRGLEQYFRELASD